MDPFQTPYIDVIASSIPNKIGTCDTYALRGESDVAFLVGDETGTIVGPDVVISLPVYISAVQVTLLKGKHSSRTIANSHVTSSSGVP